MAEKKDSWIKRLLQDSTGEPSCRLVFGWICGLGGIALAFLAMYTDMLDKAFAAISLFIATAAGCFSLSIIPETKEAGEHE